MASTTHGSLAKNACSYLERSARTVQSVGANSQEINRQSILLIEWAKENDAILADEYLVGLERQESTTAEHEVFYRPSDNRAVKRTYAGTFGVTNDPKGKQHAATPIFYLRRLRLMNRIFNSDLRLEGITFGRSLIIGEKDDLPCMVISQPWHRGVDENDPHPSSQEIKTFMESLGFSEMKGAYFGWFKADEKISIIDARPDNFIKNENGIIPIDLVISEES